MDYQMVVGIVGALVLGLLFVRNWRRSKARLKALGEKRDVKDQRGAKRRVIP